MPSSHRSSHRAGSATGAAGRDGTRERPSRRGALFAPGRRLLGSFGLVQKFAIVLVILAVPLSVISWGYLNGAAEDRAFTERELSGTAVLSASIDLTRVVVEAPWAPFDPDELDDARTRMADAVAANDHLPGVADEWAEIDRELAGLDPATAVGTADAFRRLLVTVGDASNLTLDPALDSYYLMDAAQYRYPALMAAAAEFEVVDAELRAVGASVDERWSATSDLARLVGAELDSLARGQTTVAARTSDPVVAANATARAADARRRADDVAAAVTASTVADRAIALDAMPTTDELQADWRASLAELERVLTLRLDEMNDDSRQLMALAVACLVGALYLLLSLFSGLLRSLRAMRDVLALAGDGDLQAAVEPEGKDELAEVSLAINDAVARVAAAQSELRHRATHDGLTGLPNRGHFVELLEERMADATPRSPIALAFVDLDSFKAINDLHGHHQGDLVLRTVAERLQSSVPAGSVCARLAGDEYAVLVRPGLAPDEVRRAMERVLDVVGEPIDLPDQRTRIVLEGASLGLAFHDGTERFDAEGFLSAADFAMYDAKTTAPGLVREFTDDLAELVRRRASMRGELTRALADPRDSGLAVVYQPIVDLASGSIVGSEALARWWSPSLGPVPPSEFIPLAETIGLISTLGQFVLGEAARQLARGQVHAPELFMTVNVSALALTDELLEHQVEQAAADAGLAPATFWLELTESAMMTDPDIAARRISSIRRRGHPVAIDDFGTGYSSLAYLHGLELSALKIDRSFVASLDDATATTNRHILHMMLDLARHLRLDLVAEGIETAEQLGALRTLGVPLGQGYHLHRPMPGDVFETLLESPAARPPAGFPAASR